MPLQSSKLALTLALLFLPMFAMAGNGVGNGGNVVVCQKPPGVELLDLYEARKLRGSSIDRSIKGSDPYEIATDRIHSLAKFDPKSAKVYETLFTALKHDLILEDDIELQPIDDSAHVFSPKDPGCKVQRVAVLRKKPLPKEKRLLIDKNLWEKMVPIQQAALLLHEVVYERLAALGENDSVHTRYIVSYMMSSKLIDETADDYWQMIKAMRLPIYR